MNKYLKFLILGGVVALGLNANAQSLYRCGHDEAERRLLEKYPQTARFKAEFQQEVKNYITNNYQSINNQRSFSKDTFTKIYVPVVFHILHDNGNGNVTDAQVYQEMQNINEYWSANNWDLSDLVPYWKDSAKIGNMAVEFRLAHIDPQGNPTTGIERINTYTTIEGTDENKINQWNHEKYVNIWICKSMSSDHAQAAAYAYKPATACDPSLNHNGMAERDGVLSVSSYVGFPTTADDRTTLAHELGHIMNLDHVWGGSNNPEVACGDDDVEDTPPTKGYAPGHCYLTKSVIWQRDSACWAAVNYHGWNNLATRDTNLVSNVQNIMEYSYCSVNFTHGQAQRVRAALDLQTSCRFPLWQTSNLIATGTEGAGYSQVNNCKLKADYAVNKRFVCTGTPVKFTDYSYNGTIDQYNWLIPADATVTAGALNSATVTLSFSSAGWKDVTLEVTNSFGTSTVTYAMVYVDDHSTLIDAPFLESFEGSTTNNWTKINYDNDNTKFELTNTGYLSSHSMFVNNYNAVRLREPNWLVSPSFNTSTLPTNATMSFYVSVAKGATGDIMDSTEILTVYGSKDCGNTWYKMKSYFANEFINAGKQSNYYIPGQTDDYWKRLSLSLVPSSCTNPSLPCYMITPDVKFRFDFQTSVNGNNFYIDNINIGSATTGVENINIENVSVNIFPNPSNDISTIQLQSSELKNNVKVTLTDILGKDVAILFTGNLPNGETNLTIQNNIQAGVYFVRVEAEGKSIVKRFVKL